jgi:hypothetical protein
MDQFNSEAITIRLPAIQTERTTSSWASLENLSLPEGTEKTKQNI